MPLVKPVRDLKTVRCVRRYKDKNGETKYNLRVLFNYVDILSLLSAKDNLYFYSLKADPQWNLTREEVSDAKELFKIYDTDNDGVITYKVKGIHSQLIYFDSFSLFLRSSKVP